MSKCFFDMGSNPTRGVSLENRQEGGFLVEGEYPMNTSKKKKQLNREKITCGKLTTVKLKMPWFVRFVCLFPLIFGIIESMRIHSSLIFDTNKDGTYTITKPTKIGGVMFDNIIFSRGVKVGGIDLTTLIGKDLNVEKQNGVYLIKGYYEK
ncbi:hypothetical protein ACFL0A_02375 [Patescibacteria group bacterium]